jgi:AcrR family transcriptional regulator
MRRILYVRTNRRTGRRPGVSGTRTAILDAARRQFGGLGFDRTTVRSIAAEAEVDPALVTHFFGSKQRLFLAAMDLPFEPEVAVPGILAGDRAAIGRRFAELVVSTLEDPAGRNVLTGIVRSAASEPEAARVVRELIGERVVGVLARELGASDAPLRASLAGSQVVGVVMARYVVGVEPLASLPADRLVELLAPTLQRYLVGPLGPS